MRLQKDESGEASPDSPPDSPSKKEITTMRCPYCGDDMERGLIESSEPINFLKEMRFLNQPKKAKGEFNLATPPPGRACFRRGMGMQKLQKDCHKLLRNRPRRAADMTGPGRPDYPHMAPVISVTYPSPSILRMTQSQKGKSFQAAWSRYCSSVISVGMAVPS